MTQVSKNPVRKDVYQRMDEIFLDAVADVRSRVEVNAFINDFLTPTERIMLPKRLAIAFLLHKGYEQRLISYYLKVSFTTISRVSNQLRTAGAGYRRVIEKIISDDSLSAFIQKIDDTIGDIVGQHTIGRGNWSRWRSERWKTKMATKKPF